MEELLQYIWKHKIYPLKPLYTQDGRTLEIIDPGQVNTDAGPDFFNAKVKIDGTLWVGNVEVHQNASDWFAHGHDTNKNYDSVILHVVNDANCEVRGENEQIIPTFQLLCPESVRFNYESLRKQDQSQPCQSILRKIPKLMIHSWFSSLMKERLQQKTAIIYQRLEKKNHDWENAFFITLARNYGFGLNGDTYEQWSGQINLSAVNKHRNDLFQIEAIFFGQAGLLTKPFKDDYYKRLQKEFSYQKHLFGLTEIGIDRWKLLRTRPYNFPYIRIAQLANLYYRQCSLFSKVMEATTTKELCDLLHTQTSDYWKTHYIFGSISPEKEKKMSNKSLLLIILNTVIPFMYAYGIYKGNERLIEQAETMLEELKPENNHITRLWERSGIKLENAADSQAVIQLKEAYCNCKKCLYCRFGYEFLRK